MNNKDLNLDVSIIIVNYNTKQLIADCLNSIFEQTKDINFEVIVSDNGSTDGSIQMLKADFPKVILIENNVNLGFGTANNRGLAIAKGKYIFYLNSDTILLNNAVKYFFDYWEENGEKENLGALGCYLKNSEGEYVHSGGVFPDFKEEFSGLYHNTYGFWKLFFLNKFFRKQIPLNTQVVSHCIPDNIEQITGADLFLKNDENAKFDEEFFMYREETYLEWLLHKKGKKMILIHSPQIIHLEGKSSETEKGGNQINVISRFKSFNLLNVKLSDILYFRKTGISANKILALKIITFIFWLNPIIFPASKKYMKKLLKISIRNK